MQIGQQVRVLPGEPGEPRRLSADKTGRVIDIDKFVQGFVGVRLDGEDIIRAFPIHALKVVGPTLYDADSLEGIAAEADVVRSTILEIFGEEDEDPVRKEGDIHG